MNNTAQISDSMLQIIQNICHSVPEIEMAILFGSRAKGSATERSDIDLALKGPNLNRFILGNFRALVEESKLPVSVDVLALSFLKNQELLEHIHRVGVVIYDRQQALECQKKLD